MPRIIEMVKGKTLLASGHVNPVRLVGESGAKVEANLHVAHR